MDTSTAFHRRTTFFLRYATASLLEHRLVCHVLSLRCRMMVCHAVDTASLATRLSFGKLFSIATFVVFGEKRCRKNLPLHDAGQSSLMRHVTCPACGTTFDSNAAKCVCPHCEAAFMRGSSDFVHLAEPLAHSRHRNFDDLSDYEKRYVHFAFDAICRKGGFFTEYHCIEVGLAWVRDVMLHHNWVIGTGSGLERSYVPTESGRDVLAELDATLGPPVLPARP